MGLNERILFELLYSRTSFVWFMEYKGIYGRKFRFDCANPERKIAVEIDGGIWLGKAGGHTSGYGRMKDMTKYNLATLEGWRILTYSPQTLRKHPEQIINDVNILMKVK